MRFHLITLAHLPQSRTYASCAFTQKNLKLAEMLLSLGHEVYFYASEGSKPPKGCHFIQTHTLKDIADDYGDGNKDFEIGYDWTKTDFKHDFSKERNPSTLKFQASCISEINKIKKDDDFLLITQGYYHEPIKQALKMILNCESGIGYRGSVSTNFRAFESSTIQHFSYGNETGGADANGKFLDRVIPNYFDPNDFEFNENPQDYFLYIGRIIKRKGIQIAAKTCDYLNKKLLIAGQGGKIIDGVFGPVNNRKFEFEIPAGTWEYVGFADQKKRKELMKNAKACFVPTEYLEIFGGTHIESRLCGTPVITTDFGVFPTTVENGIDGYRCSSMDDFVWAAKNINKLDRKLIRQRAERYLMDNVKWDFQRWFEDLYNYYQSVKTGKPIGFNLIRKENPQWREKIKW